jgi:hypothetical protein|nr:MAG TPA: hypothetical protein [Caudoviricetes sp.]
MTTEQAVNLLDDLSEYGLCYNITEEYQEAMKLVLSMLEEKNRQIDLMAEELVHYKVINDPDFDNLKETFDKLVENEKQYFENEAKEVQ